MSTRCFIGIREQNGEIEGVYSHFDGYPAGVGSVLLEHYQNTEKIRDLIGHGDLSSIGPEVGTSADDKNATVFYHRDRNEPWDRVKPKTYKNMLDIVKNSWYEYVYIWEVENDMWYVGDVKNLRSGSEVNGEYLHETAVDTVTEYEPLTRKICGWNNLTNWSPERAVEIIKSYAAMELYEKGIHNPSKLRLQEVMERMWAVAVEGVFE